MKTIHWVVVCLMSTMAGASYGADGNWTNFAAGPHSWFDVDCWSNGIVANGSGTTMAFVSRTAGDITILIDDDLTLGGIISNTVIVSQTLLGVDGHRLTVENEGTAIFNLGASQNNPKIWVPLVLSNTDLQLTKTVSGSRSNTILLGGGISGVGNVELYLETSAAERYYPVQYIVTNTPLTFTGTLTLTGVLIGTLTERTLLTNAWFEMYTTNLCSGGTMINGAYVKANTEGAFGTKSVRLTSTARLDLQKSLVLEGGSDLYLMSDANGSSKVYLGVADSTNVVQCLYLNGVKQSTGIYSAGTHPQYFAEAGVLKVKGEKQTVLLLN